MLTRLDLGIRTPLAKQSAAAVMFGVAIFIVTTIPDLRVTVEPMFLASILIMASATVMAAALSTRESLYRFEVIVVVLDFVAIAIFRFSTGDSRSIFTSLLLLPLVWMASMPHRAYVVWAALGGGLVVFLHIPIHFLANGVSPSVSDTNWALFGPLVYFMAAGVINEIARQSRENLKRSHLRELASSEELQKAAAVQRALLPKNERILPGYEVAGNCVPSRHVGGDFFDWYEINGGIAITMGDVMGKGVGAGMIAATARAVVRSAASDPDPRIALRSMAECLDNELRDTPTFLTLFHARLDAEAGILDYADAGHGLTLLVRADGTHLRIMSPDMPLGILPDAQWTRQSVALAPGDTLVSFSDGVLDLYDGTLNAIEEIATITRAADSARSVSDALAAIAREQHNDDDVTIIALRRTTTGTFA